MIYRVSEIVRDVRVCIDENATSERLLQDSDIETLSLNDIIRSKIEEGVRRVESVCPVYLLEDGHHFGDSIFWNDDGSGFVLLPDDFMRLISFRMSDWEKSCHSAISPEDSLYDLQSSRHKGLRGSPQLPVCAIVPRAEGKVLEFFSCKSNDSYVKTATYRPYPKIDEYEGIDISEHCYVPILYTISSLVVSSLGMSEQSQMLENLSKTLIEQ